jgi:SNF2 family DNA or RNA helicase
LIFARPPKDGTRKTTLIVVPTSLLHYWEREMDDKAKPGHKRKTLIFRMQKKCSMTIAYYTSFETLAPLLGMFFIYH